MKAKTSRKIEQIIIRDPVIIKYLRKIKGEKYQEGKVVTYAQILHKLIFDIDYDEKPENIDPKILPEASKPIPMPEG